MPELIRSVAAMHARANPVLARLDGVPNPIVVEIGTSGALMAEHLVKTRPDLILHCVDSWAPTEAQPRAYRQTGDSHAKRTKTQQDELAGIATERLKPYAGRVTVHHMPSVVAVWSFADLTADLIFDDSDHSYAAISATVRAWWRVLKPGGWFGWHDYENRNPRYNFSGVKRAVDEWRFAHGLKLEVDTGHTAFVRKP